MSKPYSFFVIEDNEIVCCKIIEIMEAYPQWQSLGYAMHYTDAYDALMQHQPDLIFLDWEIKGGNTFDLLREIKNVTSYQPFIIFNTGYQNDYPEIAEEMHNQFEMDVYLVKPYFLKLKNNLEEYLTKAIQKKQNKVSTFPQAIWLKLMDQSTVKVDLNTFISITQPDGNSRIKHLMLHDQQSILELRYTWHEILEILETNNIPHFVANARSCIVNPIYITRIERPYVFVASQMIRIPKERWQDLDSYLQREKNKNRSY